MLLVDAYEEEESCERHFIANQYSLEKYAVLESDLLARFADRRVRLVVDSLSALLIPLAQEEILDFHHSRLKSLRKKGILAMDVFVDGVLDRLVMTVIGHYRTHRVTCDLLRGQLSACLTLILGYPIICEEMQCAALSGEYCEFYAYPEEENEGE